MPVFSIPQFGAGWIIIIVTIIIVSIVFEIIRNRNIDADNVEELMQERTVLKVTLPANNDFTDTNFASFIAALHTLLANRVRAYVHISLEIVATSFGIQFYIVVPTRYKKFVEGQLYGFYPYIEITETQDYATGIATNDALGIKTDVVEMELSKDSIFPLKTYQKIQTDSLIPLLGAMSHMQEFETLSVQILLRPINDAWKKKSRQYLKDIARGKQPGKKKRLKNALTVFSRLYNGMFSIRELKVKSFVVIDKHEEKELDAVRQKMNELGFECFIRVLSSSKDEQVVRTNLDAAMAVFHGFDSTTLNTFEDYEFDYDKKSADEKINEYKTRYMSIEANDIVTQSEVGAWYHFPGSSALGLPVIWQKSKKIEPPSITQGDCIIGETNYRNIQKKFGIATEDRRRHMYVVGKTGTGKSTLLASMVLQDIQNHRAVIVIDPHGDLCEDIISRIPASFVEDIAYIDCSDRDNPPAWNITMYANDANREFIAQSILALFKKNTDSWGPRLEYILYNCIVTLLYNPGSTLLGIQRMLTDQHYRNGLLAHISDPILLRFWYEEYSYMERNTRLITETISPILNKIGKITSSTIMRNILGQSKGKVQLSHLIDDKKAIIINLAQGSIGEENTAMLGSLFITAIQSIMLQQDRPDVYLYIDECQLFMTDAFSKMLSEARKYHLNLILANQYVQQLPDSVSQSIWGNIGTLINFAIGNADAKLLEREYFPVLHAQDLIALEKYAIYIKETINNDISKPFSATTIPLPDIGEDNTQLIKKQSIINYTALKKDVEEEIKIWSMRAVPQSDPYIKPDERLRFDQ